MASVSIHPAIDSGVKKGSVAFIGGLSSALATGPKVRAEAAPPWLVLLSLVVAAVTPAFVQAPRGARLTPRQRPLRAARFAASCIGKMGSVSTVMSPSAHLSRLCVTGDEGQQLRDLNGSLGNMR